MQRADRQGEKYWNAGSSCICAAALAFREGARAGMEGRGSVCTFVLAGGLLQHMADAGADWHVLCPLGLFLLSYHRGAVRMNA